MFNTYERDIPDQKYAALAQKWDVKKWVDSNGRVRWYGCRGGDGHDNTSSCSRQTGLAVPPCDLENLADAIKFIMKECEHAGVYCELNEGSVLGNLNVLHLLASLSTLQRQLCEITDIESFRRGLAYSGAVITGGNNKS